MNAQILILCIPLIHRRVPVIRAFKGLSGLQSQCRSTDQGLLAMAGDELQFVASAFENLKDRCKVPAGQRPITGVEVNGPSWH